MAPEGTQCLIPQNQKPDLGPDTLICPNLPYVLGTGNAYASYLWSTGDTSPTITVTTASAYRVTVTDSAGCTGADTVIVEVRPVPSFSISDTVLCPGQSAPLGPSSCMNCTNYLWSTGSNSSAITVGSSGQYILTVTDTFGCSLADTAAVLVIDFQAILGNDRVFCEGDSEALSPSLAGQYTWSTGSAADSIWVSASGAYWVEVDQGQCTGRDTVEVIVIPVPMVDLGPDSLLCAGQSLLLDAGTGGLTYAWSTGAITQSIQASSSGQYAVTVSGTGGCNASDEVQITIANPVLAEIQGLDSAYCELEGPVFLSANPPGGTFSPPVVGMVFDPQLAGTGMRNITYSGTDSLGCPFSSSETVVVDESPFPPDAGPDGMLSEDQPFPMDADIPLVGQGTWSVSPSGPTIAEPNNPKTLVSGNGAAPGVYAFTWSVRNGVCPALEDTMELIVDALAIPSGFSPNGDGKNDSFYIRGIEGCEVRILRVFNRWGSEVFFAEQYKGEWRGGGLVDDTYYYTLDLGAKGNYAGYVVIKR